jgi:hypothetical protein
VVQESRATQNGVPSISRQLAFSPNSTAQAAVQGQAVHGEAGAMRVQSPPQQTSFALQDFPQAPQ